MESNFKYCHTQIDFECILCTVLYRIITVLHCVIKAICLHCLLAAAATMSLPSLCLCHVSAKWLAKVTCSKTKGDKMAVSSFLAVAVNKVSSFAISSSSYENLHLSKATLHCIFCRMVTKFFSTTLLVLRPFGYRKYEGTLDKMLTFCSVTKAEYLFLHQFVTSINFLHIYFSKLYWHSCASMNCTASLQLLHARLNEMHVEVYLVTRANRLNSG